MFDENRASGVKLISGKNLYAILIRLERASNLKKVAAILRELKEQLHHPRYTTLRRTFAICVRRVLLRRMVPDENILEVNELDVNGMLAERATKWTDNWKREGQAAMLYRQVNKRFGHIVVEGLQDRLRRVSPE